MEVHTQSFKTVVLIGATGFIGRRLAKLLIAEGHQVVAPVRADSKRRAKLPPELRTIDSSLTKGDPGLRQALDVADAVIYAAGSVRGGSPDDFQSANVRGVQSVVDILLQRAESAPPLLLISSLAASEPQLSHYARSKRDGECVVEAQLQLAATIFRPPAVYGPGDQEMRPLLDGMRRGISLRAGPPEQRLSMLHADDLARAVLAWLSAGPGVVQGLFELHDGCEDGYSFEEIAAAASAGKRVYILPLPAAVLGAVGWGNARLARLTGRQPMLSPGKVRELRHPCWVCDNDAITKALGWVPEISLREGIAELYR